MAIDPNNLPNLESIGKSNNWKLPGINEFDNAQAAHSTSTTRSNPYWFNVAQQNLGQLAYAATPEALKAAETSKAAVDQAAQQSQNLVGQAQSTLSDITSGLANPYTASGELDTSTVAGRLFDAQNQALQAQLPGATAGADAGAIASGGFGGLRNQVAGATARGQLTNELAAKQAQTLAENQGTAVQAAGALGNLGKSNVQSQIAAGHYNIAAPFSALTNYSNVLEGIQGGLPQTVWQSPSQQAIADRRNAIQNQNNRGQRRTIFRKDGGSVGMGPLRQQRMMMASGGLAHFEDGGYADRYGNEDPKAVRYFEYQYAPRSQSYVGDPEWEAVQEYGYTPDELDMKRDIARAKGYASADRDWRDDDGYTNEDWEDDWESVQDTGYTTDEVDAMRDIADAKRRILGYNQGGLAHFDRGGSADYSEVFGEPDNFEGWSDDFKEAFASRYDEPRYGDDYVPEDDGRETYRDLSYDDYYPDPEGEGEGPGEYGSWDTFNDDLRELERDVEGYQENWKPKSPWGAFKEGLGNLLGGGDDEEEMARERMNESILPRLKALGANPSNYDVKEIYGKYRSNPMEYEAEVMDLLDRYDGDDEDYEMAMEEAREQVMDQLGVEDEEELIDLINSYADDEEEAGGLGALGLAEGGEVDYYLDGGTVDPFGELIEFGEEEEIENPGGLGSLLPWEQNRRRRRRRMMGGETTNPGGPIMGGETTNPGGPRMGGETTNPGGPRWGGETTNPGGPRMGGETTNPGGPRWGGRTTDIRPLVHKSRRKHPGRRNRHNYANTRALQEFRKRERRLG